MVGFFLLQLLTSDPMIPHLACKTIERWNKYFKQKAWNWWWENKNLRM